MTMDSTLLGALIGAVIAIIAAYITSKQSYENSRKLESEKILRDKREQLFINCELVKKTLASNEATILMFVANGIHTPSGKMDTTKAHPFNTIRMLINIYLPEYKIDLSELTESYDNFHKYYSKYVVAHKFKNMPQNDKNAFLIESSTWAKKIYDRLNAIQGKLSHQ